MSVQEIVVWYRSQSRLSFCFSRADDLAAGLSPPVRECVPARTRLTLPLGAPRLPSAPDRPVRDKQLWPTDRDPWWAIGIAGSGSWTASSASQFPLKIAPRLVRPSLPTANCAPHCDLCMARTCPKSARGPMQGSYVERPIRRTHDFVNWTGHLHVPTLRHAQS